MAAYMSDGPVYNSYVEAYLAGNKLNIPADAGSRTSTANYGYGPSASAHRVRRSKNFAEGSPTTVSVLQRPVKAASAKNAENLDIQHERDKVAFERRARVYQQHAGRPYHHHAPPGSILTTFEQGNIVDRGRRKSTVQLDRGVYDPVVHSYRIDPSPEVVAAAAATTRPSSVPDRRTLAPQQLQPHHARSTTPLEHKLLQVSRGTYNPLTHEYIDAPEADYAARKEKDFDRVHGLRTGVRRVNVPPPTDPITWSREPSASSAASAPAVLVAAGAQGGGAGSSAAPAQAEAPRQRPTSAPSRPSGPRKSMSGLSWGTYNPLVHEWQVPPENPVFAQQETLLHRRLGLSGCSTGRRRAPRQEGVYNPILNTWTVPPADPRQIDGLSFKPATIFSRPTAATIRM
ncbi:hypothetical protein PLESTM_000032200 [Pleodorina starrii]|nr:hypothetical protein PLESTM_000032200 [Pleodorina starrii]